MRKHETAVCGTARMVVWEVGKCENRRQMPFMISIYLLPDLLLYIRIFCKKHFLENLFKSSDICANVCSRKTWEFLNILLIVKEFMDIFANGID